MRILEHHVTDVLFLYKLKKCVFEDAPALNTALVEVFADQRRQQCSQKTLDHSCPFLLMKQKFLDNAYNK
jgi:hypothetical protein